MVSFKPGVKERVSYGWAEWWIRRGISYGEGICKSEMMNWYQNEVDEEIKGVYSTDKVKHNYRSDQLFYTGWCRRQNNIWKASTAWTLKGDQKNQNSLARTVAKAPMSCHISLILRSLYWLRITERIEYKLLSLTNKVLTTTQPLYLHSLISIQRPRSTRSLSVVTLARPPSLSSLKITDRYFRYASPCLCNQLPLSLCKP